MKESRVVVRTGWKIHAMFSCMDCDWSAGYFSTAVESARKHAADKGHSVSGETGYCVHYQPKWMVKT